MQDKFSQASVPQPLLSDQELLDLVQKQTLKYFWDFGHPDSGMARERSHGNGASYDSEHTVTTGGTGFGIMAMIAGAERGFIPKNDVRERIHKICDFLDSSPTYRGAFPHFMDGRTGETIPFSKLDDGSDLVETSFLMAGLLTARQYFQDPALTQKINTLWENVEWDNHCHKDGLMWHWSPNHSWTEDSLPISGWNECLITYIMAASSPTHAINKSIYEAGWTKSEEFLNGKSYYGIELPLGPEKGGPLFMSQYSFLGLDPNGLYDGHTNYFRQKKNHTLINRAHCIENPNEYKGYSENCWGLTASDNHEGYSAHCPINDLGVIAPTAALSAFPFTPKESMQALRHFYEDRGDEIWGEYGFKDAFSDEHNWVSEGNLAIDQGPIVVMIENYRSGLLWNLFMSCPEVQMGLNKLSFDSPHLISKSAHQNKTIAP